MRSLVTGSSGLLGGCLVTRLRERGTPLRLLDLEPPAPGHPCHGVDAELVRDDMSDPARLTEVARGCDVLYHLAAAQRMKPQFASWSEAEVFQRNLDGVRFLLQAAERSGARKVVFVSSSGIYGIPRAPLCDESHPSVPLGAYGRSKLLAEGLCREAMGRGLDVTVLRPMSFFGPAMSGIFVMLFEWIRTGRPVFMMGSGANRVQASSAWDVAEACILATERPQARGGFFNVASDPAGVPTVLEEVRALIAHAGTGSPVVRIPTVLLRGAARALHRVRFSPIAPEHYLLADKDFVLDIRAAREALGWTPRQDNLEMMAEAYDWYVAAGEAYRPDPHLLVRLLHAAVPARASRA
jgi:nucleoside-diphosphate-sugar epimerase